MNTRIVLGALIGWLVGGTAHAYETPPPKYLNAEVTWNDPLTGQPRTEQGQLWFGDLPVKDARGGITGFGRPGHLQGIKWFTPKNPGDVWFSRYAGTNDASVFWLRDYCGERPIQLAFDAIGVARTAESTLDKWMEQSIRGVASTQKNSGHNAGAGAKEMTDEIDEITGEGQMMTAPVRSTVNRDDPAATAAALPMHFAVQQDLGYKTIPVSNLVKVVFLSASDGYKREVYGGRYVQYSRQAKGDHGRVQVSAATFFGGSDPEETFFYGGFQADGTILLAGNFQDLSFVEPGLVRTLGNDAPAGSYPSVQKTDPKKNKTWMEHPGRTPVLVQYSSDLRKLNAVVRLPWGTGQAFSCVTGQDGAIYLSGWAGPHFESLIQSIRTVEVANPDVLKPDAKGRVREPGADGFVIKIAADQRRLEWAVRFKHAAVNLFVRPDGSLLCRRGDKLFYVSQDAAVTEGPRLEIGGSNMALDPKSGAMYFGGSYRSGTGLEPYVNPYLYKVDASGKQVWTAYGWTGPIVGVDQLRLVADSSVTSIRVGEDGKLTLTAWSDGGNTVLGCQPYDLRLPAKCGGFSSSTWGARGGLTVRIAHIVQMDPETMEVPRFTRYVGYLPTSDVPTLINLYDMFRLPNGEVAVTGGGWTGFVESQDAWTTPWYIEHQIDEFSLAKGGPFFTVFTPDLENVRMATIMPNAAGLRLAGRGKYLLLFGGSLDHAPGAVDQKWSRKLPTIIRNAVQPKNGGGRDAYVALVDTQGEPNPPVIPPKTWGVADKRKR